MEDLLEDPTSALTEDWPRDETWDDSDYLHQQVGPPGELLKFSLLRRDTDRIGFLHDSFIYYFAAYGARYYRGARRPANVGSLPKTWYAVLGEHIAGDPLSWELPAEFLVPVLH